MTDCEYEQEIEPLLIADLFGETPYGGGLGEVAPLGMADEMERPGRAPGDAG